MIPVLDLPDFWDRLNSIPKYWATTEKMTQYKTENFLDSIRPYRYLYKFGTYITNYAQTTSILFFFYGSFFTNIIIREKVYTLTIGFTYIWGLFCVTAVDSLITDDEPLTEPVEWSLLQSWVLAIFGLSWIGENLISSRFGSYTGRDKRVWLSWYKTFWLIKGWYILSFGAAALFVITPFYNELSYNLTMVVGWWDWYTRVFFFTYISLLSLALYITYYQQLTLRQLNWRSALTYTAIVNLILGYLLYSQFLISFFAYGTDPNWYHKARLVDYIQLSHEPNKWSWGNSKRDHFSYHRSTTVFWFKTDLPMASAMMLFNMFFFVCLFTLYIYWVVLFRRIYSTREVTHTYLTYAISGLRQFFYYFLFFYIFIYFNYAIAYLRLPIELLWVLNLDSWFNIVWFIVKNYIDFLLFI